MKSKTFYMILIPVLVLLQLFDLITTGTAFLVVFVVLLADIAESLQIIAGNKGN